MHVNSAFQFVREFDETNDVGFEQVEPVELPSLQVVALQENCLSGDVPKGFTLTLMQVHGLPCAHNFYVECLDDWLRLKNKIMNILFPFIRFRL